MLSHPKTGMWYFNWMNIFLLYLPAGRCSPKKSSIGGKAMPTADTFGAMDRITKNLAFENSSSEVKDIPDAYGF